MHFIQWWYVNCTKNRRGKKTHTRHLLKISLLCQLVWRALRLKNRFLNYTIVADCYFKGLLTGTTAVAGQETYIFLPPHGLCGSVVSFANSNPPPERTEPNHFLRIRCSLGSVERRNYVTFSFLHRSWFARWGWGRQIGWLWQSDTTGDCSDSVWSESASERTAVRRCGAEQQHSLESWLQQCGVPEEGDLRLFWGQRADPSQVRLLLSLSMTPWSSEEVRFVTDGAGGWHVALYGCLDKLSSDSFFAHTKEKRYALSLVLSFFATFTAIHCHMLHLYFYACTIRYIQNVFACFLMVCFLFLCRTQWTGGCKLQLFQLLPSKICNNHRTKWKVTVFTPPPPLSLCVCV